jgi:HSP20 family protein
MSKEHALSKTDQTRPESIRGRPVVAPPADIFENDDGFLIVADLPGVAADKVDIRLERGELTIHGSWSLADREASPMAQEFRATDFERRFVVPDSIDVDAISAQIDGGVLRVRLPKSEAVKPRRIEVRTGQA